MKVLSVMLIDPASVSKGPSEEQMRRMGELIGEMKNKGVLLETGGRMPNALEMRITRKNGSASVTDGPFTESKEVVGGFALLEVKDRDDAIAWTNRFLDLIGDATCVLHEVDIA